MNRFIVILLLAALAGGCVSTGPVPEDRFYRLGNVQPQEALPRPLLTGGLAVEHVRSDPLHSGRAILFSDSDQPLQLRRYHYEFWIDQPPRMLRRALQSWLQASGVADSVLAGDDPDAAWRLSPRLLRFEEVRTADGVGRVELAMQFSLSSGASEKPLWTRHYVRTRPVADSRMYATADAMQAALAELLTELQNDLARPAL